MGWFSSGKKKAKKFVKKYGKKVFRKTPYGRAYTAAEYTWKAGKWTRNRYRKFKGRQNKAYSKSRSRSQSRRWDQYKSRRGATSSSPARRNRRGTYYYYRGKRIYRKK